MYVVKKRLPCKHVHERLGILWTHYTAPISYNKKKQFHAKGVFHMYCYGKVKLPLPGDKEKIHDRQGMLPNSFSEFKKQYIWVSSPSCNNSVEYFVSLSARPETYAMEETADGPGQSFLVGRHSICSLEFLWTCIHSLFQYTKIKHTT